MDFFSDFFLSKFGCRGTMKNENSTGGTFFLIWSVNAL